MLRFRTYALLWLAGMLSDIGTWMQTVAVGSLVTHLTGAATWGAIAGVAGYFTTGVVMPIGGVIADRRDRRRVLAVVSVLQCALASALAVTYFAGALDSTLLIANMALEGVLFSLLLPARTAMLPDLVPREHLIDAAALGSASWNLGRTVGPAVAAATIAWGSFGAVFIVNAVTFFLMAAVVAGLRVRSVGGSATGALERVREGVEVLSGHAGCRAAVQAVALTSLTVSPFIALIPSMAQLVLHGTAVDTARLVVAQGIGSVLGAMGLSMLARRFGKGRMIAVAMVASALAEVAYAASPNQWLAFALLVVLGFTYMNVMVNLSTLLQLMAPAAMRARAVAAFFMTLGLVYSVGSAIQGRLADIFGVREVQAGGAGALLACMVAIQLVRPQWFAALRGADGAAVPSRPAGAELVEASSEGHDGSMANQVSEPA